MANSLENGHVFSKIHLKSKEKAFMDISWSSPSNSEDERTACKKLCTIGIEASLNPEFSPNNELSPIIGGQKLDTESPVLNENRSPVLRRRKFWRRRKKRLLLEKIIEMSPEIKQSQEHCIIDERSPLNIISYPTCSITPLYHEPPSIRKARVKKGGLAHQLRKAITFYNASLEFWEREALADASSENYLQFSIINKWKEFNCSILECKYYSDRDKFKISKQSGSKCGLGSTFFIMLGFNRIADVDLEVGTAWALLSPYSTKVVTFNLKSVVCFVNASRFRAIN